MMLMGIPGCGKSTLAESLTKTEKAVIVSTDKLRYQLTGSETDFSKDDQVFTQALYQIRLNLEECRNVVYDATNLTRQERKRVLKVIPFGTHTVCYYRKVPLNLAIKRNLGRKRVVPVEIINRMFIKLKEPTINEGWDEVKVIEEP